MHSRLVTIITESFKHNSFSAESLGSFSPYQGASPQAEFGVPMILTSNILINTLLISKSTMMSAWQGVCEWVYPQREARASKECWETLPAEGLWGSRIVQGSTACLVRLIDLSASAHQGHSALVPPISSRIVQRCSEGRREREYSHSDKLQG